MKKVILIDDEALARILVREYLQNHPEFEVVDECENGFDGLKAITNQKPDLIFLDIQMPKINGFEMLELVSEPPPVIFTTAFDEYAIRAFEANAIDYLLKPFSQERFDTAISKWKISLPNHQPLKSIENVPLKYPEENQRIVVKTGNEIKILP
ncbi:MAG TPA: response regulator, partial [Catalimonadaceae bacterium]|nr:response regulator [Catalimonadaceae bacterium]